MRKDILNYKSKGIEVVFNSLSKNNQNLLNKFMDYCKITASDSSMIKIKNKIVLITDTIQKDMDKLILEDVRSFLIVLNKSEKAIATKNDIKKILKRFIRFKYKNWSLKFNQLSDVRLNTKQEKRDLSKSDLLTPDEMKLIINATDSLKYKLILLLMQETANRPEEILKLKFKDVDSNSKEIKLNSSKTGETRTIPINESLPHLVRYKVECFYEPPRNDDWVFPSPRNTKEHLKPQSLSNFLNKIERRLNFSKHLYPYLWRHSILSKMIRVLSPKVYEMYSGHSLETGMHTYSHLDTTDLKDELYKKVYDIEELTLKEKNEIKKLKEEFSNFKKKIKSDLQFFKDSLSPEVLKTKIRSP